MLGVCEKGSVLMCELLFPVAFPEVSLLSVLFVHLMKLLRDSF